MPPPFEQIDWTRFTGRRAPDAGAGAEVIAGRRVLITGGGGSIGSALARRVAQCAPARLVVVDQAEEGLAELQQDLLQGAVVTAVGDIRSRGALHAIFQEHRPDLVFHAAAYKHVPLMEANPFAAVKTNALGTQSLLDAAQRAGCRRIVVLSTDKAVAPRSIMGAAKRIAELSALSLDGVAVGVLRLGNVLGSSGSLAPLLWRQIAAGGPLTLTHRDATRYFITMDEAVHFLLTTLVVTHETALWAPEMGEQRPISTLAAFLQKTAGQQSLLPITYTGLRPGDKLQESLIGPEECLKLQQPARPLLALDTPVPDRALLHEGLQRLTQACASRDTEELINAVRWLVPAYEPSAELAASLAVAQERVDA